MTEPVRAYAAINPKGVIMSRTVKPTSDEVWQDFFGDWEVGGWTLTRSDWEARGYRVAQVEIREVTA